MLSFMELQINFLAVILAAIIDMLLGMFWYSPVGFGKLWMKMVGKTEAELKEAGTTAGMAYMASTLAAVVMAFVLAHVVKISGATDYITGAQVGFWMWLGFVVAGVLPVYIFEDRKKGLYILYIFYKLLSIVAMAVLLALWA